MEGDEEHTSEGAEEGASEEVDYDNAGAAPPRKEPWRKRSATGAILTGFALGLREALDHHKDEPQIVVQTSGDPPRDLPVEADFEYGRPRQSVVNVRPWLLNDPAPDADRSDDGAGE